MLPTIHPEGEVYLRIKAWAIDSLKVGQVVVVQDFKGRYACKRIIGIGNDEVQSKGEFFVSLYRGRQDGGIPVIPSQNLFPSWWQKLITNSDGKLKIPLGHIWLEGDNPLESVDSRHYGPLPISSVKGIILYRLWPWNRTGDDTSSCVISLIRPKPLEGEKNHQ